MTPEVKLAARVTRLNHDIATERARADQLDAEVRDLRTRVGRLERRHDIRTATVARLRVRLREARRSRDLWKHRYRRDVG